MIKKVLLLLILLGSSIRGYSEAPSSHTKIEHANEVFVDSENSKIFCRTIGKGNPLIVIHGGPGLSQDYLLPQLYDLAENNFVIFYDQRGAGKSTGEINEDTMTVPMLIKDLEAIRKAFNLNKVSLLGHSWGGFLAMHYAIEHPECVDELILSNSCPASSDEFTLFANEYVRRTSDLQEEITKIQSMRGFQSGDPDLHERLNRIIFRTYCHTPKDADLLNLRMSPSTAINGTKINQIFFANTLAKPFDLHEALKQLHIPTLIIHGDDDPVPLSTAQHLHESISGSRYVVLEGCGHFPYVEQPETYFKSLNEFLKINQVSAEEMTKISQTKKKLENFLQTAIEKDHFSGVVMVVDQGKVLLNQGYGMATADTKNEQDTVMHVASITKQFTAAAIMQLWEAGTIDLNASINTYLPEEYQSDKWAKVTVHHLLSHTGGVVDYDESYYDAEAKSFCFNDAIKAMISESQRKGVEFEPGTEWRYSNIGYTLLGAILENTTGLPYGEVIQKYIFDKVGMSSSTIHEENYVAQRGHATGHRWDKKQKKLVEDNEKCLPVTPSDGGLVTTSEDLCKWNDVLAGKRPDVLSPEILKQMTTPLPNTFTSDGGYGYGLFIDDSSGTRRIHHPGWILGFRSHFCFYPEKGIYISVFCNNSTTNPMEISSGLSEIMGEPWTTSN